MGSSASTDVRTFPLNYGGYGDDIITERYDCSPYIDHSDISHFIFSHRDELLARDRQVVQSCYSLLSKEPQWIWRNADLTVHGIQLMVTFYSGSRCNKYVVCLDSQNRVHATCQGKGLRLKLRDGFRRVYNWIANNATTVLGAITGAGLKAITFL